MSFANPRLRILLFLAALAGASPCQADDSETCTPDDYVEFQQFRRANESKLSKFLLEPTASVLGNAILSTVTSFTIVNTAGTLAYHGGKALLQRHQLKERIKVAQALRDAREIVAGRDSFDPRRMPELSILYAETNLKLKERATLEAFVATLVAHSDELCTINRRGPRMPGMGGAEEIAARALVANGGAPSAEEAGKAAARASAVTPAAQACDRATFLRLLNWKYSADGKGRWETYATKSIRPILTQLARDDLGFAGGSALGAAGNVLGGGFLRYFGGWLERRKLRDREKVSSALDAAREMAERDLEDTDNAAFQAMKPPGMSSREFAAKLVYNADRLCTIDEHGLPLVPSSKDALKVTAGQ